MVWQEWENAKAGAREARESRTRLNGVGAAGTDDHDLVVHQDDLGGVGHEAFVLHGELKKKADIAGAGLDKDGSGSTMRAAATLKSHHFGLGGELETTVEIWTSQVKHVLQACAHISNHLDYTKKRHTAEDAKIVADLSGRSGPVPVSDLDKDFR
ncbi:hypothetical protein D0Z67_13945 [Streptomyces seoulensis]|uniref:AG1 protein n=1 Tax=Streptomyces seoulensis TaxID=73044 RepID=A0A4P6TWV2_STRSO|nr:hypothetical protein [Streptomyces seoulensis]QBJ91282.1 hypothetical protein D0Z67_13945 [Streptomyces seoulensis]